MKTIIYGTGQFYKDRRFLIPEDMEFVAYADSSPERATSASRNLLEGKTVLKPSELENSEYDVRLICTDYFISSHHRVKKVYSFEPFLDTYQMTLDNFNLNEDMEVTVETEQPGWRSLFGSDMEAPKIKIRCRKASDVVHEIMEANLGYHYVLKCNTEGSEFPIFESLGKTDLLGKLDVIVMEYHRNPKPILDLLESWGYQSGTNLIGNITGFRVK